MKTLTSLRVLLLPFSWLYGGIAAMRNYFFDKGLTRSFKFDFPVISVGNLSTGGTGKTPHIEFLLSLLKTKYTVGVVSRGYGRKTRGFLMVEENSAADKVGDEPLQIKQTHPEAFVAVGEERIVAIPSLLNEAPETQVVLLDDAFQHRYVRPGMNILLTDYSHPFYNDFVLPAGNLREFKKGYKRADIIIVTKCPASLGDDEKQAITRKINPKHNQKVLFSHLTYGTPYAFGNGVELKDLAEKNVYFFAGIANVAPVEDFLKKQAKGVEVQKLADHFDYTPSQLNGIFKRFSEWPAENKVLMTTRKDAVKLRQAKLTEVVGNWPLYILPVTIGMDGNEQQQLVSGIETYIAHELSINTDGEK